MKKLIIEILIFISIKYYCKANKMQKFRKRNPKINQ